jgi:acetylornithine deacetylase/succinyl-diaminopimelate desuccinylase-like protein
VIVIADSSNASVDVPAFTTSLRGFVDATVEVRVLESAVHSGVFGGAVPDALSALCRLLATLQDDAGDVAVEGLVAARSDAPGPGDDELRSAAGLLHGVELMAPARCRAALAPAGGRRARHGRPGHCPGVQRAAAEGPRRRQPADRSGPGRARRDGRAVGHLRSHAPWGSRVEVLEGSAGAGFRLEASGAVYDLAREAFASAYGSAPVEMGIGGSIPFIAEFARAFPGATVLVTGVGDPDSRWHGIDESLHLGMWERACVAEALLLRALAD